jgi:hypothetical protein
MPVGQGSLFARAPIVRSRDQGRSWDTEPKGFAVAPRANIEALTMACWPGGYELFVGDTEGTVHMSEDGGDSWTRIADEVGCVTKGRNPPRCDQAPRRCGGGAIRCPALSAPEGGEGIKPRVIAIMVNGASRVGCALTLGNFFDRRLAIERSRYI